MAKGTKLDTSYTQNRELSWLRFNERVLEEAQDPRVPLFERLKFIAIFTSNLDEFFMVRVGSLYDLSLLKADDFDNKSFMTPAEQLGKIFAQTGHLYKKRDALFAVIDKALRRHDIVRANIKKMTSEEYKFLELYFDTRVAPILSPQVIDFQHPFPHLQNKALYIALLLKRKKKVTFGILPIPAALPRYVYLPGNTLRYVLIERLVQEFAHKIFDMYAAVDRAIICVTRNADISPDDEAPELGEDYLKHMKKTLKKRARLAPVRLEMEASDNSLIVDYLKKRLNIKAEQIYLSKTPLDLSYVFSLPEKFSERQKKTLLYPPSKPAFVCEAPPDNRILDYVLEQDLLLYYPYQSFDLFLQFVKEAVYDAQVISIKITIYRIGSRKTKLMNYLIAAAEMGKDVTVLMELRARFDEENNINWAEHLSESGCKIIYGLERHKVHSKICLVTRKDGEEIQYITQIGTGNYNAQTAALYTDFCLLTSDEKIGRDAALFFRNMGIANLEGRYEYLLVAPHDLKPRLLELIDGEIEKVKRGEEAGILLKMNSLTDRQLIDRLALASQSGVPVHLVIRGICCLLPGIAGKTQSIQITSIVGRFLEHTRVFCFGTGKNVELYISSADWMTRNTEKRVEIACPIFDPKLKETILSTLQIMRKDNCKSRILQSDGTYKKPDPTAPRIDSQQYFLQKYAAWQQRQKELDATPQA